MSVSIEKDGTGRDRRPPREATEIDLEALLEFPQGLA